MQTKNKYKIILATLSVVLFSSASQALTAAQAYALASASAANVVPPEPTSAYEPAVPLLNPVYGSANTVAATMPSPVTPDIASMATNLIQSLGTISVNFGGCTVNGVSCAANYVPATDETNGIAALNISPSVPDSAVPETILHEDIHHLCGTSDCSLNFNVAGFPTGTATYGSKFDASEPLAYSVNTAMTGSTALFAAQYSPADLGYIANGYASDIANMNATFSATNLAVQTMTSNLTSDAIGQLLNNPPNAGLNTSFAQLPNGNFLGLSSWSDNGKTALTLYDSNFNNLGQLTFDMSVDMNSAGGRAQAINYIQDKLSDASQTLAMINPSSSSNQAIQAANQQAISMAQQIATAPVVATPACNVACQANSASTLVTTYAPSVVISTLAANTVTAINNAKPLVPKPSTPTPAPTTGKSCTFNGQTVAYGASITAYSLSVTYKSCGDTCSAYSEVRTCGATGLSGSFSLGHCTTNTTLRCP